MAASTLSALEFMLKRYFAPNLQSLTLRDHVLLDNITKDESHGGSYKEVPVLGTGPQGIASTAFSTAQTNANNSVGYKFLLDTADYYMVIPFDNKALESSQGAAKAYINLKKQEIEEGLSQFGNVLDAHLWGTGGGALGQQASATNPTDTDGTITLANPNDIINFERGMEFVASADDGSVSSHSLRDSGAAATVTNVDYNAGTFTFTGTITGIAGGDYLFREATFGGNVNINAIMKGMQAWGPSVTTSSTAFFGVARNVNTRLFMGVGSADGTVADRLQALANHQRTRYQSACDVGYVHPDQWLALSRELAGQQVRPVEKKNADGTWGYSALELITSAGVIPIMADAHCPLAVGWLFKKAHMKLVSVNKMIHNMNVGDGLEMLRQATSAGYEARYVSYPQLEINKPCAHGRVTLPTS